MTGQELIEYGYKPEMCKIGILYFKDMFFINLKGKVASLMVQKNEANIGEAKTIEELRKLEAEYYMQELNVTRLVANMMYTHIVTNYPEYEEKANGIFHTEVKAFETANENWYETSFDPAIDRKKIFLDTLISEMKKGDLIGKIYRGE